MSTSDREEITDIINLYSLAVDGRKWDLFDRIFTPDAEAIYPPSQRWTALEEWKQAFEALHSGFASTQHFMTPKLIEVDADRARAITYAHFLLMPRLDHSSEGHWRGQGWYDDELVRTSEGWRISRRTCHIVFCEGSLGDVKDFGADLSFVPLSSFKDVYASSPENFRAGREGGWLAPAS